MRADEALKVSKEIDLKGKHRAHVLNGFLMWVDGGYVNSYATFSDQWQPVECDCDICVAKRYYLFIKGGISSRWDIHVKVLIKHAKCLKEG